MVRESLPSARAFANDEATLSRSSGNRIDWNGTLSMTRSGTE